MLLLQVALIALNAVFAAAEIAIVSVNDNKMAKLAKEGNKKAKILVKLTSQPSNFLATIQIAITLAGFLGSAFAADNFAGPIVEAILNAGAKIPAGTLNSIVVILITLLLSFFTIIFGELVPKRIAMRKAEKVALGISGLIYVISVIFKPVVWLLMSSTNLVLRMFKIDPNDTEEDVSEEDIRMMVDVGSESGAIDKTEQEFIQNVFEFDDLTAGEVAVHRTEVSILWLDESPDEWDKTIHGSRHKIYPICDETVDNVIGLLNAKDYFRLSTKDRETIMKKAVRPPYFVPESVKLDVLFKNMKKSRHNFAIVLDEYGGTTGIITINDLLEKLVLPLKEHYSEECANLYLGHTGAAFEDRTIPMQGFSIVLWGLVPLWAGGENIEDFSEIYTKGLSAGTNPNSKEYWGGFRNYDQKFVEIAAIAYGLLLAPDKLWEPLDDSAKKNLADFLLLSNSYEVSDNNWRLFPVLVNLALKSLSQPYDQHLIDFGLERLDSYYL
ncbi:MAG: DUF21 domain-containing protein, partial [Anaerotruncus sp.]|nr:DUF21 domain-containing protein [Anaerotruncus sp.]